MDKQELLDKFKGLCDSHQAKDLTLEENENDSVLEELNWFDMSIGYFIALGASVELAHECAVDARYKFEYWSP